MKNDLEEEVEKEILSSINVKKDLIIQKKTILKIAEVCINAIREGNKIMLCGNGGSAADAQHITAELVGIFSHKIKRSALPAIALTTNTSILTAISNDISFAYVFSRQIEGLCQKGDVLIGISTSGKSKNVINAVEKAKKMKAITVVFTGKNYSKLDESADVSLKIPSSDTQRIQESHILVGHIICGLIEKEITQKENF